MLQNFFENNFVAIRKYRVALILNKKANVRMCILNLSKILICEFHYDYIRKYNKN